MRILIVEDEDKLAKNIATVLQELLGAAVDVSHDGPDGLHLASGEAYDAIVLDLMLPGLNGLSLLRKLRGQNIATPVLILTAKAETEDVIAGLNAGSDDYLTKPFDMAELVARLRALLRRSYGQPQSVLRVGELSIDLNAREASVRGTPIELRPLEFSLLEYLALQKDAVVSKEDILEHLYDFNAEIFSNVVEVHISRLRKELRMLGNPCRIQTVRKRGYRLEAMP